MPKHTSAHAAGIPCWSDLMSTDPKGARDFYAKIFGWTYTVAGPEFGFYATARQDGHAVAGVGGVPPGSNMPTTWSVYFATDNLAADLERVKALGGSVLMPPMQIGQEGSMAMFLDPAGAAFGLWQSGNHTGYRLTDAHGAKGWVELASRDLAKSRAFFSKLLNMEAVLMKGMEYYTLDRGGEQYAGMMGLPPEAGPIPSHWGIYWIVDNTDAVIKAATAAGAKVIDPAEDTPYGRLATLMDPQGGMFKLMQPLPR